MTDAGCSMFGLLIYALWVDSIQRHATTVSGPTDAPALLFAHGFGCDQTMWQPVASQFPDYQTVLFDLVGFGKSDLASFDADKYASLEGHADDVLELCNDLGLERPVFVGHSVSSMIGVVASIKDPGMFSALVLVGPSPCYIDDGEYRGGFGRGDIDEMLEALEVDFFAWSQNMAPVIAGNPENPEYGERLTQLFCQSDYDAARLFARVTFLSDNRQDLPQVSVPTLVMQCSDDPIAPDFVGRFVHEKIQDSLMVQLKARGHTPNLTAPDETAEVIRSFLK